jgi:hypothetical protein
MDARTGRLNSGILPSPGFTYANMDVNYDRGSYDDSKGNAVPVTGTYNVWAIENIFYYVFDGKVFGGNYGMMVMFPTPATGSLVADIANPNLADLWLQPFSLGWHFNRVDFQVADGFMVPTGRYTPGASDNVDSGYFGNHLQSGTTLYSHTLGNTIVFGGSWTLRIPKPAPAH